MNRARPTESSAGALSVALAALFMVLACWPAAAHADGETLTRLSLCRAVVDSKGVDCGQAFPADVGQVHAMLAIGIPPGKKGEVTTFWRYEGRAMQKQTLAIRFYRPGGYRTRARQRIARSRTGRWSLEVLDSAGRSLVRQTFTVGADADADANAPAPDATIERVDAAAPLQPDAQPTPDAEFFVLDGGLDGSADEGVPDAREPAGDPLDAGAPAVDAGAPAVDAAGNAPSEPATAHAGAEIAPPAAEPATGGGSGSGQAIESAGDDDRRRGALMLLVGGLLLLVAGVLIARRRAGRARAKAAASTLGERPAPPPGSAAPSASAGPTEVTPVVASAAMAAAASAPLAGSTTATDALQRLTDLVTGLWSRWVAATSGSPQRALNAAWRAVSDPGRLGLDHIRLCNALEAASRDYSAIPPRGTSSDILRIRLYAQAPALIGVICALAVEVERLNLPGVGLDRAFSPWGGRAGLTAELLGILDDGAAALGTTRLALLPYETKATTAHREFDAELKPFPLPVALAERLNAGNRIVRVETPPFTDAPRPVVWGIDGS